MAQQATLQVSDTQRLKELLERVHDSDEHLVIEREGAPVAVMMSPRRAIPALNYTNNTRQSLHRN